MNRASLEEKDLARLQTAFAKALPPPQERLMLDRAMVGESLIALDVMGTHFEQRHNAILGAPLRQLAYPATAERTVMALYFMDTMKAKHLSRPEIKQWEHVENRAEEMFAIAPMFSMLAPAIGRAYEGEWRVRTQFDLAITALAVERYRLAQGQLPESLTELVPAFLPAVPKDYFSPAGGPIRYRPETGGNFVVYSVGGDMDDDGGVRMKRWYQEGDITFSVVSRGVD